MDSFIKDDGFTWDQCFGVFSDGTPEMSVAHQGFNARVKDAIQVVNFIKAKSVSVRIFRDMLGFHNVVT